VVNTQTWPQPKWFRRTLVIGEFGRSFSPLGYVTYMFSRTEIEKF
jgi:hypothetical protein